MQREIENEMRNIEMQHKMKMREAVESEQSDNSDVFEKLGYEKEQLKKRTWYDEEQVDQHSKVPVENPFQTSTLFSDKQFISLDEDIDKQSFQEREREEEIPKKDKKKKKKNKRLDNDENSGGAFITQQEQNLTTLGFVAQSETPSAELMLTQEEQKTGDAKHTKKKKKKKTEPDGRSKSPMDKEKKEKKAKKHKKPKEDDIEIKEKAKKQPKKNEEGKKNPKEPKSAPSGEEQEALKQKKQQLEKLKAMKAKQQELVLKNSGGKANKKAPISNNRSRSVEDRPSEVNAGCDDKCQIF